MKGERLFRILGLVDEDLIEEAATVPFTARRQSRWKPILGVAACVTLICLGCFAWLSGGGLGSAGTSSSSSSTASTESGGSAGIVQDTEPLSGEGHVFMSYAGPVFPLTLTEETGGITVERKTTWDFAPGVSYDGSPRQWGAEVSDSYILMNHTSGEIIAMASYPVTGSFETLSQHLPLISVDSTETDWTLYAGAYAGGFRDAGVDDGSTWNLEPPGNWTDYKALLEDGSYLEQAMTDSPTLEQPVTVYEFSDYVLPENAPDAATQAISFTIDPEATTILTYGFNGMEWDGNGGWRQYSYFVPDGKGARQDGNSKLLIVLGGDIGDYALQGYMDGGCDRGEELDGVSCTVTRYETTLDDVLNQLCQGYMEEYLSDLQKDSEATSIFGLVPLELFQGALKELLLQYGVLAGDSMTDRYSDGRLSEPLWETLHQERVLYCTFPVTIPAGESVEISVQLHKGPSFDYGCSDSEKEDVQGYDFVTVLGSNLEFTSQTAALTNTEGIEIVEQNFGLDLEAGIAEVALMPQQEYYYLQIRPKT